MNTDKLALLNGSLENIYGCMIVVFRLELLKQIYLDYKMQKRIKSGLSRSEKNGGFCKKIVRKC